MADINILKLSPTATPGKKIISTCKPAIFRLINSVVLNLYHLFLSLYKRGAVMNDFDNKIVYRFHYIYHKDLMVFYNLKEMILSILKYIKKHSV